MVSGTVLRIFHVTAGFAGLALGSVGMWAPKKRLLHRRLGDWDFAAVTASCGSAAVIAVLDWERLWYFLWAAVGT